jgi:hypothetical protein
VQWKDIVSAVEKNFDKLKIVYSRADAVFGEIAVSSFKLNKK